MFGFYACGIGAAVAQLALQEEATFQRAVAELPEAERASFIADYRAKQEKRRVEAIAERRHQELCRAIRDSKRRGFGVFW